MRLLTVAQAAEFLGISYSSLQRLRREGKGPNYIQLTPKGSVRYSQRALEDWLKKKEDENANSSNSSDSNHLNNAV